MVGCLGGRQEIHRFIQGHFAFNTYFTVTQQMLLHDQDLECFSILHLLFSHLPTQ